MLLCKPGLKLIIMYLALSLVLGLCCGFVVMSSPGKAIDTQIFRPGTAWTYKLHSTVLMNEKDGTNAKDVGFYIAADVLIESVWSGENNEKLLRIKLNEPKLHVRSRKVPTPEGFVEHASILDELENKHYYVLWSKGKVEKIILDKDEPLSLANLKKGVASLLQFQLLDQELEETDASGRCKVTYSSTSPTGILKTKNSCTSDDLQLIRNPKPLLDTRIESSRSTTYEFADSYIVSAIAEETHVMSIAAREEAGNTVTTRQEMTFVEETPTQTMQGGSFDVIYQKIREEGAFTTESLLTTMENVVYDDEKNFEQTVDENRETLKDTLLGTLPTAKSFIRLVNIARKSTKDDIAKALQSKQNKNILNQLYDVLGFVQSANSHEAAMTKLKFNDKYQVDLSERYLWALSICASPNPDIIMDLLKKYEEVKKIPEKVKETIMLSVASMAYHLRKITDRSEDQKVQLEVQNTILNYLNKTKAEARYPFLRALRNLRSTETIPILLEIATKRTLKEGVLAWKALKAMDPEQLTPEVHKMAEKTFYQIDKKHDSSSRTLSLDIILESHPSDDRLRGVLYYLLSKDKAFEVKQYTIQKVKMLADADGEFREQLKRVIANDTMINNYATLGQKGLSVALTRKFLGSKSSNGSLLTVQEMHGGIVKRGVVNVVMDKDGISQEIFSLGVFTGGLTSFFSSSDSTDTDADDTAMAGMELSVLGTQVRPFTFFNGQGELMGHVWSGTASDRTSAFQALYLLQDHLQYLRLGIGFVSQLDLKGAASFDLSGQVTFSLWHRNAESLVEKSAGILIIGVMKIDTSFIRSQVEFSMSIEPKLSLLTNVDFYSGVQLCMRLAQPDSLFKHNIYKIERIVGSKHRLRIQQFKKYPIPGKTYSLNRKNTEMCNAIFK